ncbi:hypothetical protein [Rubinisphaera margarita]|uniref:hypothetical protein n=1 Tax=Rubinisphaera margarita TaxID=2909586 RepID=UPI001EE896A5|nr:hypothetical protein [Rubinisphaera margarita]MCG6154484.1 hypothetical protein [Rubinisphaera margarita]
MNLIILANLSEISRYSHGYGSTTFVILLFSFLGILAALGAIIFVVERLMRTSSPADAQQNEPLLTTLAREHGLTPAEVRDIESLAASLELPAVELLFVDPAFWLDSLQGEDGEDSRTRETMEKLFGEETVAEYASGQLPASV